MGLVLCQNNEEGFVIPAQAGTQVVTFWVPACAGMTANPKLLMWQTTNDECVMEEHSRMVATRCVAANNPADKLPT